MQAAIAQEVAQRLAQASDRQSRHERVTSHLHATVAEEGSQALQRDRMLNDEIIDLKQRHKKELDQQQQTIDQLIREVTRQKELHQNREKEIADLRGLVEGLVARTSDRGRTRTPTPIPSVRTGGGVPPPPPWMHGAAVAPGGGDSNDEDDGDRRRREKGKGKERERIPPPSKKDKTRDQDFELLCRIMTESQARTARKPAEAPAMYKHEKHQDIRQ